MFRRAIWAGWWNGGQALACMCATKARRLLSWVATACMAIVGALEWAVGEERRDGYRGAGIAEMGIDCRREVRRAGSWCWCFTKSGLAACKRASALVRAARPRPRPSRLGVIYHSVPLRLPTSDLPFIPVLLQGTGARLTPSLLLTSTVVPIVPSRLTI